jgi:serine/threonine-protein kinase RsbW
MYKKVEIESKVENIRIVENAVDEATAVIGISKDNYGKILVSTLEAVNNAIMHGNKLDVSKKVTVEITFLSNELIISVTDEGNGFIPDSVPDPTIPENIESVNGRGVFLMKRLADEILYNEKGNSVKMIFKSLIS